MKRIIAGFCVSLFLLACGIEEEPKPIEINPCEGKSQIAEVTIEDVSLEAVDNDTQRGYIIKAKIINHTNERLEGEPNFVFFPNDIPTKVSGSGRCGDILANSVCEYKIYIWENNRPIDFSVSMACVFYTLSGQ
ncbi:MAG: hypothetical protein WBL21_02460 [Salinimicrobium sp.]